MSGLASYLVFFLIQALIYSVVALGLNLQWGYTGLFNIGVAGFFLIGSYTFAILCGPPYATHLGGFGLPWTVGVLAAIALSAIGGLIVGIPTLRLREDYLAIATIGIAVTLQLVALNARTLTGGSRGAESIPRPFAHLVSSNLWNNVVYMLLMLLVVIVIYFALEAMVRSPWGRVLKAIREDEPAASSLGKNPFTFRLQAFVIGCAIMGLGGALNASFVGFTAPTDFLPIFTFEIWAMLIVGGSGNNRGAVLGSVLVWGLWTGTGSLTQAILPSSLQVKGGAVQVIIIGLVLMLMLVLRPRGLMGEEAVVSRDADVGGDVAAAASLQEGR
ncbi:MAG TPA: branched-chain amino acid ABC transporter permease [Trueperaceae bacterium]|nr:branched-chain amino acid ABC transporter permease [Trueperaceae bacterium]